MVEIEDRVNIEIEIYRIEIISKISKTSIQNDKKKNFDSIFFDTKLNQYYFDKY